MKGKDSWGQVVVRPEEANKFNSWEMEVPEPGPGNMNEKNQEDFGNIWDGNWPDLVIRYSWGKREERDENSFWQIKCFVYLNYRTIHKVK